MIDFSGELGARDIDGYRAKYRAAIEDIGMTPETLSASYTVLIRAVPTRLRGM